MVEEKKPMQVYKLCKELGVGFQVLKNELISVSEEMGFDAKKMRPMSTLTDPQVEEIRLMYEKVEPKVEIKVEKKPDTVPWKPSRLLDIPEEFKDPNFTYRWCTTNKAGNIRKKQSEGWIIDKELHKKMSDRLTPTIEDGKPLDDVVGIRELIVMKIPNELAKARTEYYQKRGASTMRKKQTELDNEVRKFGGETYGNIEERRGT